MFPEGVFLSPMSNNWTSAWSANPLGRGGANNADDEAGMEVDQQLRLGRLNELDDVVKIVENADEKLGQLEEEEGGRSGSVVGP
jgi:hypothetical protein